MSGAEAARRRGDQPQAGVGRIGSANLRTAILLAAFVAVISLIAWPSLMGRVQYARTRAELAAIRDAAAGAELAPVGKLFTTLARMIGPSVVNVTGIRKVRSLADEIASLHGLPSAGRLDESIGSGVILSADGQIITNYHVVAQCERIDVMLADGRRFVAELIGADAASDVAVLEIDAEQLVPAEWGDSSTLEVGEMVWAIGSPFGLDRTITYGIISAVGRRGVVGNPYQEFLQTDAAINPGSSGGPLVEVHGRVMGITTAIVGKGFRGVGFAIPSNTARRIAEEIVANGHVERGHIGLAMRDWPAGRGAVVIGVAPGSPAALAGIAVDDVIVSYDGEPVSDPATLVLLLTRTPIGEEVKIGVLRDAKQLSVSVRIGRRPPENLP
jgi:serine protease Do